MLQPYRERNHQCIHKVVVFPTISFSSLMLPAHLMLLQLATCNSSLAVGRQARESFSNWKQKRLQAETEPIDTDRRTPTLQSKELKIRRKDKHEDERLGVCRHRPLQCASQL